MKTIYLSIVVRATYGRDSSSVVLLVLEGTHPISRYIPTSLSLCDGECAQTNVVFQILSQDTATPSEQFDKLTVSTLVSR